MKYCVVYLLIGLFIFLSHPTLRADQLLADDEDLSLYIKASTKIEITEWNSKLKLFTVIPVDFYGEDEVLVTPEDLVHAAPELDLKKVMATPVDYIGKIFILKSKLPSAPPPEPPSNNTKKSSLLKKK